MIVEVTVEIIATLVEVTAEVVSVLVEVTAEIIREAGSAGGTINVYTDNQLQQTIVSADLNAEVVNIIF